MNELNDILKNEKEQAKIFIEQKLGINPDNLEKTAFESNAIKRVRNLGDARVLLQLLLVYALSDLSMNAIAAINYAMSHQIVSGQSVQKRFSKCAAWIALLLHNLLLGIVPNESFFDYLGVNNQVYLLDATTFKQVGKNGLELRAHMCYNLSTGTMEEIVITGNHTAEGANNFKIIPRCLYIADAGYGLGKNLNHIDSQDGKVLFRVSPNSVRLTLDEKGNEKINMAKKLKSSKKDIVDFKCFVHIGKRKYQSVRIIARRIPKEKIFEAKKRKLRNASKNQHKIKSETLVYAEWVILMTNLDNSTHDAEYLFKIYRSRWQIELLFKRFKQALKIKRIRKSTFEQSKVLIMVQFLIWAAVERETLEAELKTIEQGLDFEYYSPSVVSKLVFEKFKAIVNYIWASELNLLRDILIIFKTLRNHKSCRINQYADFRLQFLIPPDLEAIIVAA